MTGQQVQAFFGHVHTRASDPGPELMQVGPGSKVLFTLARQNSPGFNPGSTRDVGQTISLLQTTVVK